MQVFFRSLPPSQVFWQLEYQDLGHLYLPMLCRSGCLYSQSPKKCFQKVSQQYFIIYTGYFNLSSNIPRHNQDSEHGKGSHEVLKDLLSLPWCAAHQCSAQRQSSVIQFMTSATSQRLYLLTPSIPVYIVLHSPQVQLQLEAQYMWYNTCVITLSLLPSAFSLSAHSAMAKWAGFGDLLSITLKRRKC